MTGLTTIPLDHVRRARPRPSQHPQPTRREPPKTPGAARFAITGPPEGSEHRKFTSLIDAKAASRLLGVPHTWILAQARERRIPHHRLGHYVRFNPQDLQDWLHETRSMPHETRLQTPRRRL